MPAGGPRGHHDRVMELQILAEDVERKRQKWTRDRAALEAYQRDHAPPLIREGQARFGGRFRASRRVLEPIKIFYPNRHTGSG